MTDNKLGQVIRGKDIGFALNSYYAWVACSGCGKERWVQIRSRVNGILILQSDKCMKCAKRGLARGNNNPAWLGGKCILPNGYVMIWLSPGDFYYSMVSKTGKVREHRLVMAKHLGRCLHKWEIVHHKNGIRDDNRIENLELSTNGSHILEHNKGYVVGYQKGLNDGNNKQIEELRKEIKLLQWQIKEMVSPIKQETKLDTSTLLDKFP